MDIVSNCCSAPIESDMGICFRCGEHASFVCVECDWEFEVGQKHDCEDAKQKGKDFIKETNV